MTGKIKNNFNKNKYLIIGLIALWAIVIFVTLFVYRDTLGKESKGTMQYDYVEPVNSDRSLTQLAKTINQTKTVSVRLEMLQKTDETVEIEIIGDNSSKIYGKKEIRISDIKAGYFNTFNLDEPLDAKADSKIKIVISTETDDSVGAWCSFEDYLGMPLYENNTKIDGNLFVRFLFDSPVYSSFNSIIIGILVCSVSLLILYLLLFDSKKEIVYTSMALLFGLLFIVVLTPLSGPDEEYHYRVSLIVSNKLLGVKDPNSIVDTYIGYFNFKSNLNIGEGYRTIIENFNIPLVDLTGRNTYELERSYAYWYDLCYYPQAIGITIGRLLKLNFLKTYYLGRLCSLLFYTLCVFIAVKKTPVLKNLLGVVATLPICIQEAVTYSQDMWVYGLSLVLFACFLEWYFKEGKITKTDFFFTLIVDLLLAPAKIVYSLFVIPFWFVAENKFYSKKHRLICMLILMAPMIYQIGYHTISRIVIAITHPIYADGTDAATVVGDEEYFSIQYIVAHPLEAISIVLRTLKAYIKPWFSASIGRYLSGLTIVVPSIISNSLILVLIGASLMFEKNHLSVPVKLTLLVVALMIFGLTLAAMLTGWTTTDAEFIEGVQGRYFTPLLPYGFACLNNKKISIPDKFSIFIPYTQMLILFETVIYILSYTFVY